MDDYPSFVGLVEDVGERAGRPPHDLYDEAMADAVAKIPPDQQGWYRVETFVNVKVRNPGWVDGFRVRLTHDPG